jgi:hypothetical protein
VLFNNSLDTSAGLQFVIHKTALSARRNLKYCHCHSNQLVDNRVLTENKQLYRTQIPEFTANYMPIEWRNLIKGESCPSPVDRDL